MKDKHTKATKLNKLQQAFQAPYDAASEAEFKGLMFVEELLILMRENKINRKELAARMGVGPSRVTAMLNGTSNFTLETQIRAARAVGAEVEQALVPNGHKGRWVIYREDEIRNTRKREAKK